MAHLFGRNSGDLNAAFVAKIETCKCIPFYGYHVGWRLFHKVSLLNPSFITKCANLLVTGKVTGEPMQTYESHIPFLLAFLADYNLTGCGVIKFNKFTTIAEDDSKRTAQSGLEVHLQCCDILNRGELYEENLHHTMGPMRSNTVKIASLREIRSIDAERRAKIGAEVYEKTTTEFTGVQHKWELDDDNWSEFLSRISGSIAKYKDKVDALNVITQEYPEVPTAFGLIGPIDDPPKPRPGITAIAATRSVSTQSQSFKKAHTSFRASQPEFRLSPLIFSQDEQEAEVRIASQALLSRFDRFDLDREVPLIIQALETSDCFLLNSKPPSRESVESTFGVTEYYRPFYGRKQDIPLFPFTFGGEEFKLKGHNIESLPRLAVSPSVLFNPLHTFVEERRLGEPFVLFQLTDAPPSRETVADWFANHESQTTSGGFMLPTLSELGLLVDDDMAVLSAEVHVETRLGKAPLASEDPVLAVFWELSSPFQLAPGVPRQGAITWTQIPDIAGMYIQHFDDEISVLRELARLVQYFNPDILTGYEAQSRSWGYLCQRAKALGLELESDLGRAKEHKVWRPPTMELSIVGRHVLDLWKILRKEVTLGKYTLEHVVYHCLHERTPFYEFDDLTKWWYGDKNEQEAVVSYYRGRTRYNIRLLAHFEIVSRFSAHARVTGLDFMSGMTRGSQFHVESVLCRLTKRENFLMISPSRDQVGKQNALEVIPLVMEPMTNFYTDPVCVLDFRSLYPSIVIAYNLCYSTALGRAKLWRGKNKLGVLDDFEVPDELLGILNKDIFMAPNGIAYVKENVRKSMLATMLGELLDHRQLLKDSLRFHKDDSRYQRNLNNQQMALKFIANVTYGYTSASFSGRMPCAEMADSIVMIAREILGRSIDMIEGCKKWGISAKVVYGDTDSLFVHLPKASRSQAFAIGREIADMVTVANPDPILLKLEKVYHPCILLTKKRYVGYSYEKESTSEPFFDAKGTETIRRDTTPIVQKLERKSLELLFQTSDLSTVKQYLQNQWRKILNGKISIQDFCFAQQVKLGAYKEGSTNLPGGAVVSLRRMARDEGAGPQYNERVPFVVTAGPANSRISERCYDPQEVVRNPDLSIDAEYYINQAIIPPLDRLFNIFGASVRAWYADMPRPMRIHQGKSHGETLRYYMKNSICPVCLDRTAGDVCERCRANLPKSIYIVQTRSQQQQQRCHRLQNICRLCSGAKGPTSCRSLDCPVYYEREGEFGEAASLAELTDSAMMQLDS